jgi:hypothetical protein
MAYNVSDLFAAACGAQRINGDYIKVGTYVSNPEDYTKEGELRKANKSVMLELLTDGGVTDEDRIRGEELREHHKSKLLEVMNGSINEFGKSACEVASMEIIQDNQLNRYIALIASLPKSWERSSRFERDQERRRELGAASVTFGNPGDAFRAEVEIVSCFYSKNYFRFFCTALYGTNLVNFAVSNELKAGSKHLITGRIHKHVDGNVTKLHYVRTFPKEVVDSLRSDANV